jgi:hypothetical protein
MLLFEIKTSFFLFQAEQMTQQSISNLTIIANSSLEMVVQQLHSLKKLDSMAAVYSSM